MEFTKKQTFPHQRIIRIHREAAKSDFLGIKNENWMAASRDLGAHALRLYLYLAANANNYELALSPAAVQEAIGMPRSTYHDQFRVLVSKRYLVPAHGNTFDFYEMPQPRASVHEEVQTSIVDLSSFDTPDGLEEPQFDFDYPSEDIEINNTEIDQNNAINIAYPRVKEIRILNPKREGKIEISKFTPPKAGAFEF